MRESHYKTIVGVFALVCLSILGILVIMFSGSQTLFAKTYPLNIRFEGGVVGVQAGQSVTLNGVRVGQTKKVEFWNSEHVEEGIRVIVTMEAKYGIPEGASVSVASSIMGFGKPAIMINVAGLHEAPDLPRDGTAVINGVMTNVLDQMLPPDMQATLVGSFEGIKTLADALKPVAANLEILLQQRDVSAVDAEQAVANLSTLVQRFDQVLKNVNTLVADAQNVENLRATLANARVMSERGAEVMEKLYSLGERGSGMADEATELIRDLRGSVEKISLVLTEFNKTAAALNDTKGTAGMLMNDNRLYEELVLSARRLSAALDELRAAMEIMKKDGIRLKW